MSASTISSRTAREGGAARLIVKALVRKHRENDWYVSTDCSTSRNSFFWRGTAFRQRSRLSAI
jgi:hypothetical protein